MEWYLRQHNEVGYCPECKALFTRYFTYIQFNLDLVIHLYDHGEPICCYRATNINEAEAVADEAVDDADAGAKPDATGAQHHLHSP